MARRTFNRGVQDPTPAARLVREQGYSAAQAATSLGVDPRSIRDWVAKFAPPPVETPGAASRQSSLVRRTKTLPRPRTSGSSWSARF